jgi:hypothetical protein
MLGMPGLKQVRSSIERKVSLFFKFCSDTYKRASIEKIIILKNFIKVHQ